MLHRHVFIVALFCFFAVAMQGEEPTNILPHAEVSGDSSTLVAGCVNVITGSYSDAQLDFVLVGPEALPFQRFYCSADWKGGSFRDGWNHNYAYEGKIDHENGKYWYARIPENSGGSMLYFSHNKVKVWGEKKEHVRYDDFIQFDTNKVKFLKGLTNIGHGAIGARTNLRNQTADWRPNQEQFVVHQPDGTTRFYKVKKKEHTPKITHEKRPSGNQIHYQYNNNELSKVTALDATGKVTFGSLSFTHTNWKESFPVLTVTGSDGQNVRYTFHKSKRRKEKEGDWRFYVYHVNRSTGPPEEYKYSSPDKLHNEQIIQKSRPEGRIQQIQYYQPGDNYVGDILVKCSDDPEKDTRPGKVSLLKAPMGHDATLHITHRFLYNHGPSHNNFKEYTSGIVDVLDAVNHKVRYCFSGKDRITAIERYTGQNVPKKYSTEKFYWGSHRDQECNLTTKALLDANGVARSCRYLEYDQHHNVIAEHIVGNLRGKNPAGPALDDLGIPHYNGGDRYTIQRSYYPPQAFNLLKSELLPNGRLTEYRYWGSTPKLQAKLVSHNGHTIARQFHEYDQFGSPLKTIVDDGEAATSNELLGVTVRRITYLTPRVQTPCMGLPEVIAEHYYDTHTRTEHHLSEVANIYSREGRLTDQHHLDADDLLRYSLHWEYDPMGNVTLERNAIGQITQRWFDPNGNKIKEQGPCELYHTEYAYDYSNRLVSEKKVCTDGQCYSQSYRYDLLGNRIASIDIFGNETNYEYDEFHRLVRTTLPPTVDANGNLVRLKTHRNYDIAGNVIAETDVMGNVTRKEFNIRGQPTSIQYPDGTSEHFEYYLDGSLKCKTAQNGTSTHFHYDVLGNVIRKETFSSAQELLSTTTATYRGALLLSETDANGNSTHHAYDAAGRPIKVTTEIGWSRFEYDSLGRKCKTIQWIGPSEDDVQVSYVEYDLLNRVVEERLEDRAGTVFDRSLYEYDSAGHRCAVTTFSDLGPCTTRTFYDGMGKVYKIIDAEGNETIIHDDYSHLNAHGQKVLCTTTIDPLGNATIATSDTLGRIVSIVRKDVMGQEIACATQQFDGNGRLIRRVDTIKGANAPDRNLITERQYDSVGHLVGLYEAVGTPKARRTLYTYNKAGEKEFEFLADGVTLHYEYDSQGRLACYSSSDQTVHYRYTYDANNNVLAVVDEVQGTTTLRSYDCANRLTQEILGNGLKVRYQYDGIGRMTRMGLPDESGVTYTYNAAHLEEVSRIDPTAQKLYSHAYLTHDASGHVTASQLIKNAGDITYTRDKLSRLHQMKSLHFQEDIPLDGYDAVGNLLTKHRRDIFGENTCRYAYDDLYQLVREEGMSNHAYAYDSLNNRLSKDDAHCEIDEINQLLRQGDDTYTYDARGNRTAHSAIQYAYDALGRLTEVRREEGRWSYQYDAFNRRISKTRFSLSDEILSVERYLYSGHLELGAFEENGILLQFRMLGKGLGAEIGAAVAIEIGNELFAPLHDHQGSVVALLDPASGNPVEVYRYTAFGEENCFVKGSTGDWTHTLSINPWRFSSKRYDPESGLINFGRRYFDPKVGRWATPDPKGYDEGPNLYAYLCNRPLTFYDLYGLQVTSEGYNFQFADTYGGAYTIGVYHGLFHPVDTCSKWTDCAWEVGSAAHNRDCSHIAGRMNELGFRGVALAGFETAGEVFGAYITLLPVVEIMKALASTVAFEYCYAAYRSASSLFRSEAIVTGEELLVTQSERAIGAALEELVIEEAALAGGQGDVQVVERVINETLQGRGMLTSQYQLSPTEALDAAELFLGPGYREIGQSGSGVFRSVDGFKQFRMDTNSMLGQHKPWVPHVHFEIFTPTNLRRPYVSNHVPFTN